jgi:Tfp pilus assembly protein PilN
MIEINLLPGSVKRTKRKSGGGLPAVAMPKIKLPPMDKYIMAAIGMWAVAILLIVYMQLSTTSKLAAAKVQYNKLVRDTAAAHDKIELLKQLNGRSDTIAAKLKVIQELDAGRFDLAHILDEIGRNVPDYTWLVSIQPAEGSGGPMNPSFRIEGRMGNPFALPKFIIDLESSPFIANVTLKKQQPVIENGKPMYMFSIEGTYEQPPAGITRTVPLFGPGMLDSTITERLAAPDTTMSAAEAAAAVNAAGGVKKPAGKAAPGKTAPGKNPPAKTPAKPAGGKANAPAPKKGGN